MATNTPRFGLFPSLVPMIQEDTKKLRDAWLRFFILGVALIVLGVIVLGSAPWFTIASVQILGVFLIVGAAMYLVGGLFRIVAALVGQFRASRGSIPGSPTCRQPSVGEY